MTKYIAFFIVCFAFKTAIGQVDSTLTFYTQRSMPTSYFAVGSLGELYVVNTANELKKYDENGDSVGVYNLSGKFGPLTKVEAQNPWQTILLYEKFATLVLLDKYLNVSSVINLRSKNIFSVRAITTSYDNNIWLYDEQNARVKKIDISGNVLFESVDMRQVFDVAFQPQKMVDEDGLLYLYDPINGMYIFDYYGSFKSRLPFYHWKDFMVKGKKIIGVDNEKIYQYFPPMPITSENILPAGIQNSELIRLGKSQLYALKNNLLSIYKITQTK